LVSPPLVEPPEPPFAPDPDVERPVVSKAGIFLTVVRRAGPRLIEASLIPTLLFYCCLVFAGIGVAYAAALAWVYTALLVRIVRNGRVSPLLILAAVGITIRTVLSVVQDSSFLYFVQPVLGSVAAGVVFLGSIALGRPIVHALAHDFWPLTPEMLECPGVVRLLRRLTFLWAGVNFACAAATFTLLVVLPLPAFVAIKQFVSWGIIGVAIAITIDRSVRTARREGFAMHQTVPPVPAAAPAA
jgi:intracellular septation protein A